MQSPAGAGTNHGPASRAVPSTMDAQTPAPESPSQSQADQPITLDRSACLRLEQALFREWLETDGLGGYASSSALACNARRYHGLLVAPLPGGGERHVFMGQVLEDLIGAGRSFPLSTVRYAGVYAPDGYQAIEAFALDPMPTWTYQIGDATITRQVLMVWGEHTTLVRWQRTGGPADLRLRVRPLYACRRVHDLTYENMDLNPRVQRGGGRFSMHPYPSLPGVHMRLSAESVQFDADPVWYRGIEYVTDRRRGFDCHEDNFNPGRFEFDLPEGQAVVMAVSLNPECGDPLELWQREAEFRTSQRQGVRSFRDRLVLAADSYFYRDAHGRMGVMAGYPWFGEWGRDTFIALPGLCLPAERFELAEAVLAGALPFLQHGLLPNTYGADRASSSYRSADAALWFARAVLHYQRATGEDEKVAHQFGPALREIANAYLRGTDLGVRVDADGRFFAGSPELNATWMDAMVHGQPVTPRDGSPVELQALWYQLLCHLSDLEHGLGDDEASARWKQHAEKAGRVLREDFWIAGKDYLADRLDPQGRPDPSLRCNMVLAAGLEYSPLTSTQRSRIVQVALDELLTPRGLRTLAPGDAAYIGRYEGGPELRDAAYHQGTVWPWPLGFLVEAALRVYPDDGARVRRLRKVVSEFAEQLPEHGLGHLSEVFDGDPPHRPGGTPAQAWSVAEVLRAAHLLRVGGA
ncbi:MAG: amylo-alpha-1,6-glucosidase [Planctomycetota bacterium]